MVKCFCNNFELIQIVELISSYSIKLYQLNFRGTNSLNSNRDNSVLCYSRHFEYCINLGQNLVFKNVVFFPFCLASNDYFLGFIFLGIIFHREEKSVNLRF